MNVFLICLLSILRFGEQLHTMNETPAPAYVLLKATYRAVEGSDVEYGQGAIEKQDLPHREIEPMVWLIEVPPPAEPLEWQRRLNEGVDRSHGAFTVTPPSADEQRRVEAGEITMQQ